jgi:NADH-quinone oxidoreductase subunit F
VAEHSSVDLRLLDPILEKYASQGQTQLIPVLFEAQQVYGYLPAAVVAAIGDGLRVPLVEVYGVVEFYSMFYRRQTASTIVRVCSSPMCAMAGGKEALEAACEKLGVALNEPTADGRYMVEEVQCLGLCDHAPAALVGDVPVSHLDPAEAATLIENPQEAPLGTISGEPRWLTGRCGVIDPLDIGAFQANDGFAGLKKAIETLQPEDVIAEIKDSGLVGRGGAAFPTGLKWEYAAAAENEPRYVVGNGDESEPGTFKDRVLMEGDPFAVIEGMVLNGYAVGAHQGYLYVRGEYPRAQRLLRNAIETARKSGFLGENVLGSTFSFDIELRSGAGAYICGEETALFESIEGKRGYPRLKPPFPTTHGLFHQPTTINNVETLCTAAWIVANGAEAYRTQGTEKSPGTKLFCLSGDIAKPGVYETPFGTSLGELLDLAGGMRGELQAILVGGAAGVFAVPSHLDVPMSFEDLQGAGLVLGSGVVMAINQTRDLRETLLALAHFFAHESCGKCFPCQLGTQRQLELVTKVVDGSADENDLQTLQDVIYTMTNASLCGLGMTAGVAIQSAMNQWPEIFLDGKG